MARPRSGALSCVALGLVDLWPLPPGAIVVLVVAAGFLVLVAGWLWVRRTRAEVREAEAPPFLLPRWRPSGIVGAEPERNVPVAGSTPPAPLAPPPARPARRAEPRPMPTPEMPVVPLAGGVHAILVSAVSSGAAPDAVAKTAPGAVAPAQAGRGAERAAPGTPASLANGVQAPQPRPPLASGRDVPSARGTPAAPSADLDATLQLLPGRFEVVGGAPPDGATGATDATGGIIRFVRQPGRTTQITIGRQAGEAHRHVRLDAPTVSRLHARLSFDERRWSIANLSRTNPVRVNGRVLSDATGPHLLAEGDRVEIGEFVLVFRER